MLGGDTLLSLCHQTLMSEGFKYHGVSVIYRPQDLGYHVMIMEDEEEKITPTVKASLKGLGFTYSIVKQSK